MVRMKETAEKSEKMQVEVTIGIGREVVKVK